jgi:hypothetical protein
MSKLPSVFVPKGALEDCLALFPYFEVDFELLVEEGYLEMTSPETCKWLKSKTSLAQYFKWLGKDGVYVPGGFWAPVEEAFGMKRHSLRRVASKNANVLKKDESIGFMKIKPILEKHREEKWAEEIRRRVFRHIKRLINEIEDEKPETIMKIFEIIKMLFSEYVDKKNTNRR